LTRWATLFGGATWPPAEWLVRAEVLRGVVSVPARARMELLFSAMHEVAMVPELWTEVAELAWELDRRGEVLPLTDIAIAACAKRAGATVITTDLHFAKVPGLKVRAVV